MSVSVLDLQFHPDLVQLTEAEGETTIHYPGAVADAAAGEPDLPSTIRWIALTEGTRIASVRVVDLETVELGECRVRVANPERRHGDATGPREELNVDPSPDLRPTAWVEVGYQGSMRGHRLASLIIHPLRWEPSTRRLFLARRLRLEYTLEEDPTAVSLPRHRIVEGIEQRFEPALRKLAAVGTNAGTAKLGGPGPAAAGPFQPTFRPTTDGSPVEYVIVTSELLAPQFQRLADWKTNKGVQATIRTIEWIDATYPNGVDQAERVRFFIRDAYQNWGTLWVLLGGDTDQVPFRSAWHEMQGGESIPVDYYFMCLDDNWNCDGDDRFGEGWTNAENTGDCVDLLPEVYAGRAPVSTPAEADVFVTKTLRYELESASGNGYPASALFLSERLFPSLHGAEISEEAVSLLEQHAPWFKIVRLYTEPENWPGSEELTLAAAIDSVNNGFGIVHHVGHGYINTMSVGEHSSLGNADIDNLMNGDRQSVVLGINCSAASIDFNCIGERWVKNAAGGGVAYLGTSRLAFPEPSREVQQEWYRLVFEDSLRSLGEAAALARLPLIPDAELDNWDRWTIFALTLLGDPETDIYTKHPITLDATHAATHELGSGVYSVSVSSAGAPLDSATVTAWKAGDFYTTTHTDAAGVATLELPAAAAGSCTLTVHKSYYLPYQSIVSLTSAAGPYAAVEAIGIDDDTGGASLGDGDGLVDAGETIELAVTVRNSGGGGMTDATGVITVDDPGGYLILSGDSVSYGAIAAGDSAVGDTVFVVAISPSAPAAFQPVFTLELTATEGTWADIFVLPVHRAHVAQRAHDVDDNHAGGDGDGLVDPGEEIWYTIDLRNSGQETAFDVDATLRVLQRASGEPEPLVTIADDEMSFGDIAADATVTGDRFEFTLDATVAPESIVLEVIYTDLYAQTWGDTLDLTPPGVADSLRAFGSTDAVTLKWRAPPDEDILGYDIYRADNESGPFDRVNPYIAVGSATFEDQSLEALTRYYYRIVARDSSYNAGEPSEPFLGTTNPPLASGWPIALGQQVLSSLQLADIDSDGQFEVFTAADYQYGWHADGMEIVDGDNDPRTSGVFAVDGFAATKGFGATTALGDVDQDGDVEICNIGWTVPGIYLWNNVGEPMPGWPKDAMGDFNWASPVLADLDLDDDLEIIVWAAKGGRLFAWHHDGVEVVDGDNDPTTDGIMRRVFGVSYNYSSPAVANLDADEEPEIVFCTNQPSLTTDPHGAVYVINADGTNVPGWPVATGDSLSPSAITASPAIVDLDGDGSNEIIVASELAGGTLHVFAADGTDFGNWPVAVPGTSLQARVGSPVVGDVDGNSHLDIVYAASNGELWAWDRFASVLSGFPVTYLADQDEATQSTPAIADIDGDDLGEILFGDEHGYVHAYNHDGTPVDGFPIFLGGEVRSTPLVTDIDGDDLIEIAVSCWNSSVYVWDLPYEHDPEHLSWPMFRHDSRNTGYFGSYILPIGVGDPGVVVAAAPVRARVVPPYPNPFNPQTRFLLEVPGLVGDVGDVGDVGEEGAAGVTGERVRIALYDVQGRLVRQLMDRLLDPGRHSIIWDGRTMSGTPATTGVYFYEVVIGEFVATGKLTLVK